MTERESERKAAPAAAPDAALDAAFDALRARTAGPPSQALLARVLADAEAQAGRQVAVPARREAAQGRPAQGRAGGRETAGARLVARFFDWASGWPAPAGLAAAVVAGLWLGIAPPPPVLVLEQALLGEMVYLDLDAAADVFGQ